MAQQMSFGSLLARPRRERGGVLLLIVLSMLVLFTLIGVTFVITATRHRVSARAAGTMNQTGDSPQVYLDGALGQVLFDTLNPKSSLRYHSLLGDIYGGGWLNPGGGTELKALTGKVSTASALATTGGQIVEMQSSGLLLGGTAVTGFTTDGYFNGCVLTMLDGPAKGLSTRIVGFNASGNTFRVLAFQSDTTSYNSSTPPVPVAGNEFLINGRAFAGTGVGLSTTSGILDAKDPTTNRSYALQPNTLFFEPNTTTGYSTYDGPGGTNEDYDAWDFQNMFLARIDEQGNVISPSFHQPKLIRFWQNHGLDTSNTHLMRRIMLRPLGTTYLPNTTGGGGATTNGDHTEFTGSNPGKSDTNNPNRFFNPIEGPWDVDNDGDGKPDSVWVDLGYQPFTAPDGRLAKPLFAIMVLDMDGRININAQGNLHQINTTAMSTPVSGAYAGGGTVTPSTHSKGFGMGPAEIDLTPALTSTTNGPSNLLIGRMAGSRKIEGRYGEGSAANAMPGDSSSAATSDYASRSKLFELPMDFKVQPASYGSPPDIFGHEPIALDWRGHPYYPFASTAAAGTNDAANHPYEVNLSLNAPSGLSQTTRGDNLFGAAEFERLLRCNDVDSRTLPPRLTQLLGLSDTNISGMNNVRHKITPHSFDVPAPAYALIPELRSISPSKRAQHVTDMLRQRLIAAGLPETEVNNQLRIMLPHELVAGVRMDVNRPFGNGRDDNANNMIDDILETAVGEDLTYYDALGNQQTVKMNHLNDDPLFSSPKQTTPRPDQARQILARHLYVLMLLLHDNDYIKGFEDENPALTATDKKELLNRRIAQWAVNVVDFRDSDSAMTPFEYDANPFNAQGWRVDGIVGQSSTDDAQPHRRLVWGCEYPELLLTESLAFHDRRVKDSANDNGPKKKLGDMPPDPNMDQHRIPQGSAFLELYCPRSLNNGILPHDLYDSNGLMLDKLAPASPTGAYPVWRVVISKSRFAAGGARNDIADRIAKQPESLSLEPDRMSLLSGAAADTVEVDRIVTFSTVAPPAGMLYEDRTYYSRTAAPRLMPGRYAVVGPRATTHFGLDSAASAMSTQKLTLTAYTDPNGATPYPTGSMPPVGIIAAAKLPPGWTATTAPNGIGFSISEPLPNGSYYPIPDRVSPAALGGLTDGYGGAAADSLDTPLDSDPGRPNNLQTELGGSVSRRSVERFKTAVLQRLANPMLPFNPEPGQTGHVATLVVNPYRTVDWLPMDLTVFNGEDKPATADPDEGGGGDVRFGTRQRGFKRDPAAADNPHNVWNQLSTRPTSPSSGAGNTNIFPYSMNEAPGSPAIGGITLGFLNSSFGTPKAGPGEYTGDPQKPFPWIPFFNRPYANALELMYVPATSSARLLWEHRIVAPEGQATQDYKIDNELYESDRDGFRASHRYLLNFFQSETYDAANPGKAPELHRIFDMLTVPSRFVGTETVLNPQTFVGTGAGTEGLHPPFNTVSRQREPGKLNLNTMNQSAFQGLMANFPSMVGDFAKFERSRQDGGKDTTMDPYPAETGVPFRSAASADLVPHNPMKRKGVEVGLLRPDPTETDHPLFHFHGTAQMNDSSRSPFFAYQGLTRLGGMTTTRSNVYAVWITVGFFEVEKITPNGAIPSGYRLRSEIGSDSGGVKRHRGFYMIDRSIPVGYQRGMRGNTDRAVLIKRIIE